MNRNEVLEFLATLGYSQEVKLNDKVSEIKKAGK